VIVDAFRSDFGSVDGKDELRDVPAVAQHDHLIGNDQA
jgi:hypothetical protein